MADSVDGEITAEMVNFFNAFGFVKIKSFFASEINFISKEFDRLMNFKFKNVKERRNYLFPQFIDNSPSLSQLLDLAKINKLAESLLGSDFVYKGSDGNIFSGATPWHRDYLVRTKTIKMLIYLERNRENTGALRVIPGSHFVDDSYSSFLGDALTWPEPPVEGGFDEKSFFGKGHNPKVFGSNRLIPQTVVTTSPGDVIVFNHNLIHSTNATFWPKRRRLLGLHFAISPYSDKLSGYEENMRNEIRSLALLEMNTFKLDRMFGPYILNSTSPTIQRLIAPLKDLALSHGELFDGRYLSQSDGSIEFCGRLKSTSYKDRAYIN